MKTINKRFENEKAVTCCSLKCKNLASTARCVRDDYNQLVWIYICKECAHKYDKLDKEREKERENNDSGNY